MPPSVPDHLVASPDQEPLSDANQRQPRIYVCNSNTPAVIDGHARPGDVLDSETLECPAMPLSILAVHKSFVLYPPYAPDGDNTPIWTKPDNAETRALPECQWTGPDKKTKPLAAETIRLTLHNPKIGVRMMTLQRTAIKSAKALLTEIDAIGCVLHGPLWNILTEKSGKVFVPKFVHAGFNSPVAARDLAAIACSLTTPANGI